MTISRCSFCYYAWRVSDSNNPPTGEHAHGLFLLLSLFFFLLFLALLLFFHSFLSFLLLFLSFHALFPFSFSFCFFIISFFSLILNDLTPTNQPQLHTLNGHTLFSFFLVSLFQHALTHSLNHHHLKQQWVASSRGCVRYTLSPT